eukprot:TRINITY_DN17573_c0_g2_i1.p1 TRINITY_DN17573_c0_g2~~TRINITY_DN17573_c0_g2_i1.p1  ORF type:complete len:839 (+),score=187.39 TRINITY_DN17573_c0_g2_i1:81-2597(+)
MPGQAPAYQALLRRREEQTLSITFILGLPRGGTTAIEKHLYSHLPFDTNINEPSLHLDLGAPAAAGAAEPDRPRRQRSELTFSTVVRAVEELEATAAQQGRDLVVSPLRVLVKEVTNKVLPWMVPLWARLADCVVVVHRNPSLQLESRIKSIVDRVTSGALRPFGLCPDSPAAELRVAGHAVLPGEGPFSARYAAACRARDFAAFRPGLTRLAALHPFCADPECQQAFWGAAAPQAVGGLPEFAATLPGLGDELCRQLLDWRLGWRPLREQLKQLGAHPGVVILDFSAFQMAPPELTEAVARPLRAACPSWVAAEARDRRRSGGIVPAPTAASPGSPPVAAFAPATQEFALRGAAGAGQREWDEAAWQAWYGTPCFAKVSRRDEVEPVLKAPVPAARFPDCCQESLRDACALYAELAGDPRAARVPPGAAAQYAGIDPLFDAVTDPAASAESRAAAAAAFAAGRPCEPPPPAAPCPVPAAPCSPRGAQRGSGRGSQRETPGADGGWRAQPWVVHVSGAAAAAAAALRAAALCTVQLLMLLQVSALWATQCTRGLLAGLRRGSPRGPPLPPPDSRISVIIPCLNEEGTVATALHSIRGAAAATAADTAAPGAVPARAADARVEVIVVDAGCADATMEVARRIGAAEDYPFPVKRVTAGSRGRGPALRAGVAAATGQVLLFLHADCTLPEGWDEMVLGALRDGTVHSTAFRFQMRTPGPDAAAPQPRGFAEWTVQLRSTALQLPFGDQAIALSTAQLAAVGGVPDIPIMEDYALMSRLMVEGGRTGRRVRVLPVAARCSARRFDERGLWQANLINQVMMLAYRCGVPPALLYRLYYGRPP